MYVGNVTSHRRLAPPLLQRPIILGLILAGMGFIAEPGDRVYATTPSDIEKSLRAALDEMASQNGVVNAVALVNAPTSGLSWCKATGIANPQTGEKMTSEHLFRIASVSKTLTAVVIFQLIEEGELSLDSRLVDLLSPQDLPEGRSVKDLLVIDNKPRGQLILIRHLLSHASGLPDYWGEPIKAGPHVGKSYVNLLVEDCRNPGANGMKKRQWTAKMILDSYFEWDLPAAGKGLPGETYHYADTNFVLLGLIIEKLTKEPLHTAYRHRIYEKLGMTNTFLEWHEPFPTARLSHTFFIEDGGETWDLMQKGLNTSADWAGGGLVSTAGDLNLFLRGLFHRRLFRNKETLDVMIIEISRPEEWFGYAHGIFHITTKRGHKCCGHFGASGVSAFHFPQDDVTVILTRNQSQASHPLANEEFVSVLDREQILKAERESQPGK